MKVKSIILSLLLMIGSMAVLSTGASAGEAKFELKSAAVIKDILAEFVGKRVAIRLNSNEELEGTVTKVGDSLVHLSKLSGKDFYDAVVLIDRISAVSIRVR
jgi:hypothetical protein